MPTGRGYPTAGYSAAAQQYRSATPLLDQIGAPTIKGVRDGLTYVTEIKTRSGVMQIAEPFLVPLEAPVYQPLVNTVATRASAAAALVRVLGRVNPYLNAALLVYEGWELYQKWNAPRDAYTIPGVEGVDNSDGHMVDIPNDWVRYYTYEPGTPGKYWDTWNGAYFDFIHAHPETAYFDHIPYDGRPYGFQDVVHSRAAFSDLWTQNPIGQVTRWMETSATPGTVGDDLFPFVVNGWWSQGSATSMPTASPSIEPVPARTVMPEPQTLPQVPYDAIPYQDAWSNPLTERGPKPLPKLSQELYASEAGRTYFVQVRPDGRVDGGSVVPPTTKYSRPPPPGTKERKFVLGKGGSAGRIFGTVTEVYDFVDCLFSAIPLKQRLKDGVTKRMPKNAKKDRRNPTGGKKFQDVGLYKKGLYVAKHFDTIDIKKALNCIVINEIQDRGIGLANQMANTVTKNPYWVSPRGSGMIAPKF